ncbi:MAG: alpha/beta hydrolase [Pseudomonadota bacterium]
MGWVPWTLLAIVSATAGLVGAALYSHAKVSELEARYPPLGEFHRHPAGRLHYIDRGAGKAILLVHGANTSARDFEASIAPLLSRKYRVVAIDRPGYGYSDRWPRSHQPSRQADALQAVVAALGLDKPVIVGHSLGGAISLAYALKYPNQVGGLVLLGGVAFPWSTGVDWHYHVASWPVVGPLFTNALVLPVGQRLLPAGVKQVFSPNAAPSDYLERTGLMLALRPKAYLSSARDLLHLSEAMAIQSRDYERITQPVLLITGSGDEIVAAWNHSERLVKVLPQATLRILSDVGHAPHHTLPTEIARAISEFVDDSP